MNDKAILTAAVVVGLIAYGAKRAAATPGTSTANTGPDAIDDWAKQGINLEHTKTHDTSTTPFPIEGWSGTTPNPKDGSTTKLFTIYATDDPTSYAQGTKSAAGKVSVTRKGLGGFTGAIIKQL